MCRSIGRPLPVEQTRLNEPPGPSLGCAEPVLASCPLLYEHTRTRCHLSQPPLGPPVPALPPRQITTVPAAAVAARASGKAKRARKQACTSATAAQGGQKSQPRPRPDPDFEGGTHCVPCRHCCLSLSPSLFLPRASSPSLESRLSCFVLTWLLSFFLSGV